MSNPVTYVPVSGTFGTSDLLVGFTAGASGALPSTNAGYTFFGGPLVRSITKGGVGSGFYTINLTQPVLNITQWNIGCLQLSFGAGGACDGYITTDNSSNAAAPAITVQFNTKAGVAVDPSAGDKVRIYIGFQFKKA
jgi:hypothetical protein